MNPRIRLFPLDSYAHTLQSVGMVSNTLEPTLWRTCRVIANTNRLGILHELMLHPGQSVSALALRFSIDVSTMSIYLRALNARSLLRVERRRSYVLYSLSSNPSIPWTKPLLNAILHTFRTGKDPEEFLFRQATAFTHPRRVQIVHFLANAGTTEFHVIRSTCRISSSALTRHLKKLHARGFINQNRRGWRCLAPRDRFSRVLFKIAREYDA